VQAPHKPVQPAFRAAERERGGGRGWGSRDNAWQRSADRGWRRD